MRSHSSRSGFALPFALVTMAVAAISIAALGGYAGFSSRMARHRIAHTKCRLAAQSALELTKIDIAKAFERYVGEVAPSVKITPIRKDVYRWFDYGDEGYIGTRVIYPVVTNSVVDGCAVRTWLGKRQDRTVYILARATCRYAGGPEAVSTIEEVVVFGGIDQSPVFDNAYFVNNYGWMSGSSIVINGSMRANGNVSLSGSTVNGFVYAAANSEVGANGTVSLSSSPQIKNAASYRSAYGNRSRPDTGDYQTADAFDAPERSGSVTKPTRYEYDDDGTIINRIGGTRAAESGDVIINEYADAVPMPFVSDLDDYVEYAKNYDDEGTAGKLTAPAYTYTDGAGTTHAVAAKTVTAHYEGTGPSGDSTLADDGALVLIGTSANPIVIDGPVVVDSDVIIKGYVRGQGTIYSGRNVHIIGDLKYVNPPTWSHSTSDDNVTESSNNETKDMLGLVAKGNVVIGDSTSSSWHSSVDNYIKRGTSSSVVKKYACDESDANIGYPSTFQGNYTAVEQVSGLSASQAADAPGGYSGNQFGKVRTVTTTLDTYHTETTYDRWGRRTTQRVYDTTTELQTVYDRKYYETVCDDKILSSLKDSYGISQIDAILYNNHGIFGTPGRSGYNFNLNGSLVCRDEALIFSGNGIRFNWDFRLGRRSNSKAARKRFGLPVGLSDETRTISWREVADD